MSFIVYRLLDATQAVGLSQMMQNSIRWFFEEAIRVELSTASAKRSDPGYSRQATGSRLLMKDLSQGIPLPGEYAPF